MHLKITVPDRLLKHFVQGTLESSNNTVKPKNTDEDQVLIELGIRGETVQDLALQALHKLTSNYLEEGAKSSLEEGAKNSKQPQIPPRTKTPNVKPKIPIGSFDPWSM